MLKLYKKVGQTPLELLNELREQRPELKNEKLSYAGRLDPMAEGEIMVMVGKEENARREEFLIFDKTYEAQILFGFSTDSHDILGLIEKTDFEQISSNDLKKVLKKIKNIKKILYPHFSSKTVQGKPLFQWKREGRIKEIKIPEREIKIKKVKLIETRQISATDLLNYIDYAIGEVRGDFRQQDILNNWHQALSDQENIYQVAKVSFSVSSGTYIRGLTDIIGDELGVSACLLKLVRTKIHN